MILELDAGNTTIKWRLLGGQGEVLRSTQRISLDRLDELRGLVGEGLISARASCVAGPEVGETIAKWVKGSWGLELKLAQTKKVFAGLKIAYADPSRLGVDRWLAMLAACAEQNRDVCVIDAGSAITVDLVRSGGDHLGGYIVPGLQIMKRSVVGDTRQILMSGEQLDNKTHWGACTDEAVNFGINRMAVSFIESILSELAEISGGCRIFISGGDAVKLQAIIKVPQSLELTLRQDIVLDGLAIALP